MGPEPDQQNPRKDRHSRAFLNAALPGIWLDARGRIVEMNDAAAELLDVDEAFVAGRPAVAVIDAEDRHDIVNFIIEANAENAGSLLRDVRIRASDGVRNVKVGIAYIPAEDDPGFFMQLHDVTDLRATEAALDKTEESYRRFFEDHTVAMYRTRPSGEFVDANHALADLAGYPHPKYLLSLNAGQLYVRPQDRAAQIAELDRAGTLVGRDFELARLDGTTIWVRDFGRKIQQPDGTVIYEGALFDVTQRYMAEAQLRNRALQQASISALGQLALQSHDAHAVALSAVRMAQEVLNIDVVTLLRGDPLEPFARCVRAGVEETVVDDLEPAWLESKVPASGEAVVVSGPHGGFVSVFEVPDVNGATGLLVAGSQADPNLTDDDMHFMQSIVSVIAATLERSEARSRLEALISSKDEFIASISHEVRTPLTVVMGIADELHGRWAQIDSSDREEMLAMLVGQTQEMVDLIEDLLVAARADIGKLPVAIEAVDIRTTVDEVVASVRKPSHVDIQVGQHSPLCYADPIRLRQIVRNLLTNAFRYGGESIRISASGDQRRVWLDVADNGEGVPPAAVKTIFDAYERGHRTAGRPSSVGLGLTVSRKLARLMDGELTYRYEDGSVFTLELNAAPAEAVGSSEPPEQVESATA